MAWPEFAEHLIARLETLGADAATDERVSKGEITAEDYKRITGDDYDVA